MFISEEFKNMMEQDTASLQEIWQMEDEHEFISAMSTYIAEKCKYGAKFSILSKEEQVFDITQTLEMEVNNGGFYQFLYNAEGDVFSNVVSSFKEIGAEKTAALCQNAFDALGEELPADRNARILFLAGMEDTLAKLMEFDEQFYAYEEDLDALSYQYILANKNAFS